MSTSAQHIVRVSRQVKKLEKPRPLKIPNQNRHSTIDARLNALEEVMTLAETVAAHLSNVNYDRTLQGNIISLNSMLKTHGKQLEAVYKDQLDRAFVTFRNGCRDENLDFVSRVQLLELIELRAMKWVPIENFLYYKHKLNHQDVDIVSVSSVDSNSNSSSAFTYTQMVNPLTPVSPSQPLLLSPGELVKSSGKFAAPTKIPGKSYCKDEVVIRNSDSGKVNPGAKERLVQITGPTEDKIIYAKQLMEETIKRNASPVRSEMPDKDRLGSSSSLNSSTSDDSLRYRSLNSKRSTLLHSFSTSDANLGEYKYTVTVGENNLKITGSNPDLVRIAKLVLDDYFSPDSEQFNEYGFDEETEMFESVTRPDSSILRVNSQDSEESEDTFKVQFKSPSGSSRSSYLKTVLPDSHTLSMTKPEIGPEQDDYFPDAPHFTEEEAKIYIEDSNLVKKKGVTKGMGSPIKDTEAANQSPTIIRYTNEEILHFAKSPASRVTPKDWVKVMKEFPAIVKKLPVEWFDPEVYAIKRPQEADAVIAIQSQCETGSPEVE